MTIKPLSIVKKCKKCGKSFPSIFKLPHKSIKLQDECIGCTALYQEEFPDNSKKDKSND